MSKDTNREDTNQCCGRADALREFAFDELAPEQRAAMEQHLASCDECLLELDRLRLTVAALRVIPEREMPRRIAFVSGSPGVPAANTWFGRFWSSGPRLGFASACVLSLALATFALHRPAAAPSIAQSSPVAAAVSKQQVDEAVSRAVAQVRAEVTAEIRAEDARTLQVALEGAERKHEQEHRALLVAMEENMTVLQKRLNTYAMLASADMGRPAGGE